MFRSKVIVPLSAALWLVLSSVAAAAEPAAGSQDAWHVIYLGGQRVGFMHQILQPMERDGRSLVRTENDLHLTIKRFGQPLTIHTNLQTEETREGGLLSFRFESANPPASTTRMTGRVVGKTLRVETTIDGQQQSREFPWKSGMKSPTWQDRGLLVSPPKPGETRTIETFLPEFSQPATVTVRAGEMEIVKLLEGERRLLRTEFTQSVVPNLVTKNWLDERGVSIKTSTGLLGTEMVSYAVEKDEAVRAITGTELDLAVNTLVKISRIPQGHRSRKVVYRITVPGEDPAKVLPNGDTQRVKRLSPDAAEVMVTALPVPDKGTTGNVDAEYLQSNQYLQSKDARVIEHAEQAVGDETDPARQAVRMEKYVHERLTEKNFSTALASAAEVARTLEGDCTEHAVLLAAMLRAKRIPSRIAVGLVYIGSRASFGGHMWTEASLNGRWVPLDATLGQGGIGAAHITMAVSSFSDDGPTPATAFLPLMSLLGNMAIEVVSAEGP